MLLPAEFYLLIRLNKNNNIHAPSIDTTISQGKPPPPIPKYLVSQPPIKPPITPTIMLPIRPNPELFKISPANHQ